MVRIIFGIFIILHGLVHLLYFGQSANYFELKPGMVWPDGTWAFSKLLGNDTARILASIFLIAAAIGFIVGSTGFLVKQDWWRTVVVSSATFSSLVYILFWDGTWQNLTDKGAIGILINVAILAVALIYHWPD